MPVEICSPRNVDSFIVEDDGVFPNSPRPVGIYEIAVKFNDAKGKQAKKQLNSLVALHGWRVDWFYYVYQKPHYHTTTDEVLVVYSGEATLELGGPINGKRRKVLRGDVVRIPAGVVHRCLWRTEDFRVFGLYPQGVTWDMVYGKPGERKNALRKLRRLTPPQTDAIYGDNGYW